MTYLLFGIFIGATLALSILFFYFFINDLKKYTKPLLKISNEPLNKFKFIQRVGNLVTFKYEDLNVYLYLNKKEIYMTNNNDVSLLVSDTNREIIEYLHDRLINSFGQYIYSDITTLNEVVYSNNLIRNYDEENVLLNDLPKEEPDIDDILDKINKVGINNLNQKDLNILNKNKNK
jgi:hypothetical protein